MDSNQQNDDRLITAPIKRLHDQVLAPERHDLFLSALAVVHKMERLTREEAEIAAYLMMQTGDPADNFHGWVRLAMWARFHRSQEVRMALTRLKKQECVEALYKRHTIDALKVFRKDIVTKAAASGWNKQRAYIVGNDRKAQRDSSPVTGLMVDWWKLVESRKKDVLSEFKRMLQHYEGHCDKGIRKRFLNEELPAITFNQEGWSSNYSDKKLWASLGACYEAGVDPFWVLQFYSNYHGALPLPEALVSTSQVINRIGFGHALAAQRVATVADVVSGNFNDLIRTKDLRGFYTLLLDDKPIYDNALAVQLKAASLGIRHVYFVNEDYGSFNDLPEMYREIFKRPIQRWLLDIRYDEGVLQYLKRCLPSVLVRDQVHA